MKRLVVCLVVFVFGLSAVYAAGLEVKKKAGEYDVTAVLEKNPPVVGKNAISIEVKDKSAKTVSDAKVVVEYSMPPMPGMPPHGAKRNAEFKNGKYAAVLDLSMRGAWNITVKIEKGGKTESIKFTVDVQ